jgi:hypothetical protein
MLPRRLVGVGLLTAACLVLCCAAALYESSSTLNDRYPSLYEISTRPWLWKLSQKLGRPIVRLRDIPTEELQMIRDKGFNIVWFMGVWQLGT